MMVYSVLFFGVFHGITPSGPWFLVFPGLGFISLVAGLPGESQRQHADLVGGLHVFWSDAWAAYLFHHRSWLATDAG
jgi:hypothetical protein